MNILKKYRKVIIALAAVLLCVTVVLCVMPIRLTRATAKVTDGKLSETGELTLADDPLAPQGMKRAVSNDRLTLYLNTETGAFSVYDIENANYWNSNPTEEQITGSYGMGTVKSEMRSQILLTYYDANNLIQYFNSFDHCAKQGNITVNAIENGISVTYKIGESDIDITMLPAAVDKEKFEEKVLSKLPDGKLKNAVKKYYKLAIPQDGTERQKKRYAENFTDLDMKKEYYFLDLFAPDYVLPDLYDALFRQTDYVLEDFEYDNKAVGYTAEIKTLLQVQMTVEYTLDGKELNVRIPSEGISAPENIYVTDVTVLPFFGTAGKQDSGYMFVPDGSGALIDLNNGRIQSQMFNVKVYGTDDTIIKTEQNISANRAYFPVFAMVKNNSSYLAIIEQGDAIADISSRVSGMSTDFNQLYSSFNILPMDKMVIKTNKADMSTNVYAEEYYKGDISISYSFYGEQGADYSALAREYRSYLLSNGTLKEKSVEKNRLNLSLTGKITVEKNIAGIGFTAEETVTSFDNALEIVKKLKKLGVENLSVTYSSWYGGGLSPDLPDGASPAIGMGGKTAIADLIGEIGAENLTFNASVLRVWQGFPNINPLKYVNRAVTNRSDVDYRYNVSTNLPLKDSDSYYILKAGYVSSLIDKYSAGVKKLGTSSLAFDDLGNILASDFEKANQTDRTLAKQLIIDTLSKASKDNTIKLNAPNIYAAGYADMITELPTASSKNNLINTNVPFMQIVLSGCVDYTVPSVNGMGTAQDNILKAVETGSELYFDWIYAADEKIASFKGIQAQLMFSKNYENWIEFAAESYNRINDELADVCTGEILSHKQLADGVYCTEWKNGSVIVNYNDKDFSYGVQNVPAKDFAVVQEG